MNTIQAVRSKFDVRDYKICSRANLPVSYECPEKVRIKNQGSKPTCVAHAASSLIEYHYKRLNNGSNKSFSTEFIYGTRDIGYYVGDGMMIRDALKTLVKYGDCFKTDCPGNNDVQEAINNIYKKEDHYRELASYNKLAAYFRCTTNDDIKTAIIDHGPVLVSMNTYSGAKIVDDVYTYDPNADHGRHCVMVYGWDERGWLIQNSWGESYAGDGRFVIPFDYKFNEAWGVTNAVFVDNIEFERPSKFKNFIYRIYNKIVNWWLDLTDRT